MTAMEKKVGRLHLQLALDRGSLAEVRQMAAMAAPYVDTLEVGTPLLMREGVAALRQIRAAIGEHPCALFADSKISDEGSTIARICLEAGADAVSVVDGARFETLQEVRSVADEFGKQIWVDLLNHDNPIIRAHALAPFVDGFILHRSRSGLPPLLVEDLVSVDRPIRIAGGLTLNHARALLRRNGLNQQDADSPLQGIIVGRAITDAESFDQALEHFSRVCRGEKAAQMKGDTG